MPQRPHPNARLDALSLARPDDCRHRLADERHRNHCLQGAPPIGRPFGGPILPDHDDRRGQDIEAVLRYTDFPLRAALARPILST